ncbi:hypothetical protein BVC93_04710 [Mycobacterium sp. MS1601]|nr:hypothetical protein BVC93_04710 [Mycobacterium sp. MS1601]
MRQAGQLDQFALESVGASAAARRSTHCARGGEGDVMPSLAGSDAQYGPIDRWAYLFLWPKQDDILFGGDEIQGAGVRDLFAFEGA